MILGKIPEMGGIPDADVVVALEVVTVMNDWERVSVTVAVPEPVDVLMISLTVPLIEVVIMLMVALVVPLTMFVSDMVAVVVIWSAPEVVVI